MYFIKVKNHKSRFKTVYICQHIDGGTTSVSSRDSEGFLLEYGDICPVIKREVDVDSPIVWIGDSRVKPREQRQYL